MKQKGFDVNLRNMSKEHNLIGKSMHNSDPFDIKKIDPDTGQVYEKGFEGLNDPYLELEINIPSGSKRPKLMCWSAGDFIIFKKENTWRVIFILKGLVGSITPTSVEAGVKE